MYSDVHWQPLALPDSFSLRSGWLFIQGKLHPRQPRGETRLRWQCRQGRWHEQTLPVTRRGTLQELVYLPMGASQLALLASSQGADCLVEITQARQASTIESLWRRLRRVWPFYGRLNSQKRRRLGLSWHLWLTNLPLAYELVGKLRDDRPLHAYEHWLASFDTLQPGDHQMIMRLLTRWDNLPRVCLHLVGEGDTAARQRTLASIETLCYPASHVTLLEPGVDRPESEHTAEIWHWAIPLGAETAPAALFWVAHQLRLTPDAKWIYGDHDLLDDSGKRHSPHFKPDWNETLLHGQNYIGWCALWCEQGEPLVPADRVSCHHQWLLLSRRLDAGQIAHIPVLMMHQPCEEQDDHGLIAQASQVMPSGVTISPAPHGICRWHWPLPAQLPRVSVIIPTRNGVAHLKPCIDSLVRQTRYPNLEILVMDNQSDEADTLAYLAHAAQEYGVRVIPYDHPFNYSAINNAAVGQASGELICLLNNDTEVMSPSWLEEMVSHLLRPGVGVVGAKLYYGDGRVQHGGDAVGPGGCADHFHAGLTADDPGYQRRAVCAQELSAVTAACLLTHRELFLSLGGLDDLNLPVAFNDVDYCLRAGEAGWRIVWTPFAELYHHESVSRGKDVTPQQLARAQRELRYMKKRWAQRLKHDPAYNPNLSYDRPDFSLSHAPNVVLPWMK
ncbi:glycosyltransferase family 2 protein [Aeromonas taiwanensis]|uniref:glycosyltransferase family 2 protein n=1 Tax=Aeromonas taiwanensis TaxID=633417 RepID=UPI00248F20AE|nr:glycosyltransferase family 2 protein [Aeromonas taiwanensis]